MSRISVLFYCDHIEASISPIDGNIHNDPFLGSRDPNQKNSAHRYGEHELGFGILKKQLEESHLRLFKDEKPSIKRGYTYPVVDVTVVNRFYNYDTQGRPEVTSNTNLITAEMLERFSQIWIFGMHAKNNETADEGSSSRIFGRNDHDWPTKSDMELSSAELSALGRWMDDGGGVLITGDHSNKYASAKDQSLNLGRSLGHKIKRASELRVWIDGSGSGVDTALPVINTMEPIDRLGNTDNSMTLMLHQEDDIPQTLAFMDFSGTLGEDESDILFSWQETISSSTKKIRYLPDHGHEGMVRRPSSSSTITFDKDNHFIWPRTNTPYVPWPNEVAFGRNFTYGDLVPLVVAYSGQLAGVGNIVAHSTWHHFTNVNLVGFLNGKNSTPILDEITAYYVNLAVFLENPKKREKSIWDRIWIEIFRIKRPIPDDFNFGSKLTDRTNPIPNRSTYSYEIGRFTFKRLSEFMSPSHLRYFLRTEVDKVCLEHGLNVKDARSINLAMFLGEIVALTSSPSHDSEKNRNLLIKKAVHQALKNHLELRETPLSSLKNTILSLGKQIKSEVIC